MDFRISRVARQQYTFDESLFGTTGDVVLADPAAARRFALRMAMAGGSRPDRPVHAGDIDAIGLIHEVQHRAVGRSGASGGDRPFADALRQLDGELGRDQVDATLAAFEAAFPSPAVHAGMDPAAYLHGTTGSVPNREVDLEEMLLLWVANQNPAFMVYGELFDASPLSRTAYAQLMARLRELSRSRAETHPLGEDLVERLLAPGRASPASLSGQLRWILDNWPDVVGDELRARLTLSLDILAEEETAARQAWERTAGDGGGDADSAALGGFRGEDSEDERFSPDKDWMPSVVLMAKSTYVWLDQLSRTYGHPIWTLDGIPDAELDRLRDAGVTGLWLIGLWERSHASQQIKQLRGNPEAVASAYSLMDYRIAEDLGGEVAYGNLRDRAWSRGIRLASDMVPNHMGIDSRWVIEHPDWFLQRPEPPFPSYSFGGPNLSRDERVGIYLEDHYFDNSDAAVVFRRQDRWSGQERFIYHGNDGTSFPWNDTAQLDYLNPETREAVIQTILAVARRFPIIRFDAAMTLARRHVQRLWYPLPGQGGAIPSRAEYAMPQDEFDRRMPAEFWREVVDRVAKEAPDTLLLAEAFWMLEGYFVRTLGMHRVYNSAFMHMLRDEKNAEYRTVINETIGFDPEILKRYVNFMNNPDERTAIDQFGDGDKYFGVATMLATLPGLPMLGHGQIEGFAEKYGMEFRRAALDERPNPWLMERHEREIFPLLRQRWRFAEANDFRLYDFATDGDVDQNVFAYSNGWGDHRSLIVYHNRYGETRGWIPGVGAQLGLADDGNHWLILRDQRSGLEFLRNAHDLHSRGLELELHAYQAHVFLSLEEVADGPDREFARLAWRLGLAGVPDVRAALADQRLEPLVAAVGRALEPDALRAIAGAALATTDAAAGTALDAVGRRLTGALGDVAANVPGGVDAAAVPAASALLDTRLRSLTSRVRAAHARAGGASDDVALGRWLGTRRARWATLVGWAISDAILQLASPSQADQVRAFDGWAVDRALGAAARGLGLDDAEVWRVVELVRALVALGSGPGSLAEAQQLIPGPWFDDPPVRSATGWNDYLGDSFVRREAYTELLDVLAARDTAFGATGAYALARARTDAIEAQGYRVSALRIAPKTAPPADSGGAAEADGRVSEHPAHAPLDGPESASVEAEQPA